MQKEINLLPQKNISVLQQERTIVTVRIIALFSVLFVVSSFLAILFVGKNYSVDAVVAQQTSVRSRMQILQSMTTKDITLVDRIGKVQAILKKRSLLTDKINAIQKQVPSSVTIDTLTVSTENLSLSVSSPSLSSLKTFIDNMSGLVAKKTLLQKVTITDVVVDATTGKYTVNISGIFL